MKYVLNNNIKLVEADVTNITTLLNFQKEIISQMNNEWFMPLTFCEFKDAINNGKVYFLCHQHDIAGIVVLNCKPKKEILDEYLLDDTSGVGILDSVMISENYRGSKLQLQVMIFLESEMKANKLRKIVATVHPDNVYSFNNFIKANYKISKEITIHGGKRYIFEKSFHY